MNRRQRRRQRRRVAADPELYAQQWTVRAALATLVLLFATVATDTRPGLVTTSHALVLVTLISAAVAVRLARHGFKLRLAHRRDGWNSGDPTIVMEDIADMFDVDEAMVATPGVTLQQVERSYIDHIMVPTHEAMAARITAALHKDGTLLPGMRLDYTASDDPA
jgi:hypothetical protein